VEIRHILGGMFDVVDLSAMEWVEEVEETGATFEENATLKALAASAGWDGWVIADDSGLEVDALGGAPGVKSARFSGENANDSSNRARLLEMLAGVAAPARSARFRCVIVLARAGKKQSSFSGAVEGTLLSNERGAGGFGYDSLFVPAGYQATFAELPPEVKNALSHRARALAELKTWQGWK
jgi:XTP/dITP diphosphohydrolase